MKNIKRFTFNKTYFIITLVLLAIEIYIGMYVNDTFVRPYLGDFLVVILIYTFLKSFWTEKINKVAFYVLIFSFIVEILQYFKIVEILGLQDINLARILIGTSFAWEDMLAYVLGIITVLVVEFVFRTKSVE